MALRIATRSGDWTDTTLWRTGQNPTNYNMRADLNVYSAAGAVGVNTTPKYTAAFTAPSTTALVYGIVMQPVYNAGSSKSFTIALQENGVDVASKTFSITTFPQAFTFWYFPLDTPYTYTTTSANTYRWRLESTNTQTDVFTFMGESTGVPLGITVDDSLTTLPSSSDDVYIVANFVDQTTKTVTMDASSATCRYFRLNWNTTLEYSRSTNTQLTVGDASSTALGAVDLAAQLLIGTSSNPIPAQYTAVLAANGSGNGSSIFVNHTTASYGRIEAAGSAAYNANATTIGGYVTGTYQTTLANAIAVGATSVTFTDDLGLRPGGGDQIVIGECRATNPGYYIYHDVRTTTAYNPATKTATLSSGVTYVHDAGAHVGSLTRNVQIRSETTGRQCQTGLLGTAIGAVPATPSRYAHVEFRDFSVGPSYSYNNITSWTDSSIVGCTFYSLHTSNRTAISSITSAEIVNCVMVRCDSNYGFNNGYEAARTGIFQNTMFVSCRPYYWWNYKLVNCFGSGTIALLEGSYQCVLENPSLVNVSAIMYACQLSTSTGGTLTNSSYVLRLAIANTVQNLLMKNVGELSAVNSQESRILHSTALTQFTNPATPLSNNAAPYNHETSSRDVSVQNLIAPGTGHRKTATYFKTGYIVPYTSATVPEAVFPVPSGASIANRIESIKAGIKTLNVYVDFRWPVIVGPVTANIPVYCAGWGTGLPSASELYVELTLPGAGVPIKSSTTVLSNGQWTTLTVSGTSSAAGFAFARVYLKKYIANAVMYVDWPLGMSTTNLDWYEGRPNEYVTPLPSYTGAGDLRSVRIDGPGVQEFKIPVNSRLTTIKLSARYDGEHGTTTKPQMMVLANPEIGVTQQTAAMTAAANTWETLTLNVLPTKAGVLTLRMQSRSATPWGKANFDNLTVT